jgi:2-oxoglutarate dehydrogenase E2 component (dihydrolipoamide succinyltransferase)
MERMNVTVIGKPYQGRPVGEQFEVSRRDARLLVALERVSLAEQGDGLLISDAVRKLAEEVGLDVASLKGTGKDGRITKADVEAAVEQAKTN